MSAKRPPWEQDLNNPKSKALSSVDAEPTPDDHTAFQYVGATPYLGTEETLASMHPHSRMLREAFVAEYMFDFNPRAAAIRAGFRGQNATDAARTFMDEPIVQRLIRERQQSFNASTEITLARISAGLLREANREDPTASHAARVNAFEKLAKLHGLGQANTPEVQVNLGGVMVVPAVPSADAWEAQAAASQGALKADVAN